MSGRERARRDRGGTPRVGGADAQALAGAAAERPASSRTRAARRSSASHAGGRGGRLRPRSRLPGRVPVHARRAAHACTAGGSGRCGSTRASARRPRPTSATATCSSRGRPACRVAFDLPTQMGYDADDADGARRGRQGRRGRSRALRGHGRPLRGHPARPGLDLDDDQRHRVDPARALRGGGPSGRAWPSEQLSGTVQNDILKEYIARGHLHLPARRRRCGSITDIFACCRERVPRWNTISISGYHMREAGCTAAQEVAFTLANGDRLRAGRAGGRARRRRVRAAALVLLQRPQQPPRGGRQVPGRPAAVGAASCASASAPAIRAR